jgi:two-component system sensor histidine kinase RegB
VDVIEALWTRKHRSMRVVAAHVAFDLVALTLLLVHSGGAWNPLVSVYLVYLAVLAMVLPGRAVWWAVAGAMALQAVVVWMSDGGLEVAPGPIPTGDLLGHVLAFDLAALAITWVVRRLTLTLRRRESERLDAQRRRDTVDRLAALGTLTAGVAHELATPIGTLQLMIEDLASGAIDERKRTELLQQIERCRSLLERLRGRNLGETGECVADVAIWVEEWRRAVPDVDVEVRVPSAPRVAGAEASWRGALWVTLDNARQAGARHVSVEGRSDADAFELWVQDDGRGIDPEGAARAGEPFRSQSGSTGLGLFVARTFAQSVGGDVVLESLPSRGARARIRMPRAA